MSILSIRTDESSGIQTTTANELSDGTVPGAIVLANGELFPLLFDAGLATLTTATGQVNNPAVALSGYSATSPNGETVDIPGLNAMANIQDVGFTVPNGQMAIDQNGNPLKTTDGHYVYLYVYSLDNNILIGREGGTTPGANPNGDVVFAAYLDTLKADGVSSANTSTGDAGATSAKVWMVQYQPLHHLDPNNPNDVLTLGNDLKVFVDSLQSFSLEGAPSGQNLFLMFGDSTPASGEAAIIVTGKKPINQSDPAAGSLTSGDTVNTGQGGGMTTIGSNNQMIDPKEGMYFTFVKLGTDSPVVTVPNLDQNEADLEANIKFDSFLSATQASFGVVQLQPPKGATLKISALNNTDTNEKGVNYIDGLGDSDDVGVSITSVTLTTAPTTANPAGESFTFTADGSHGTWAVDFVTTGDITTVTIAGATAGDTVNYLTATSHNRLMIDNVGNENADLNAAFDIGAFKLGTGNLTPSSLGAVTFVDDAPTAAAALGAGAVTHDETAGVQSADGANDTLSGTVSALFSGVSNTSTQLFTAGFAQGSAAVIDASSSVFGADGAAATNSKVYSLTISVSGVESGLASDNGTPVLLYKEGDLVVGRIGGTSGLAAFAVAIDPSTGVLSLAQYSAILHADISDPNDSRQIANTALQAVVTVTDSEGDQSTASVNIGNQVKILDDGPSVTVSATDEAAVVLTTQDAQTVGAASDSEATSVDFSSVFASAPSYGADGAGSTAMSYGLSLVTPNGPSGLASQGAGINLFDVAGVMVGSTAATAADITEANTVFSVAVVASGASAGTVTLTQYAQIDHAIGDDPSPSGSPFEDQLAVLGADLIKLTGTALSTDFDGDTASDSKVVDLGGNVRFADDGPSVTVSATDEAAVVLTTQDAQTVGAASDSEATSVDFSSVFASAPSYGADGAGSTAMSYGLSLVTPNGPSGLASQGAGINLFDVAGVMVGSTAATAADITEANTVFSVAVVASGASAGTVTLTQYAQIDHAIGDDPSPSGSPFEDQLAVLGADLIKLTGTALSTDFDGDTASDSKVVDLGGNVRFADDGPSVTVSATDEAAVVLTTQDAQTVGAASDSEATSVDFSSVFASAPSYGADGAGSTAMSYGLSLVTPNGPSGLASQGAGINLFDVAGVMVGSTAATAADITEANTVFSVAVVASGASAGTVTLTQYAQIDHAIGDDPSPSGSPFEDQLAVLGADLIKLTGTALSTDFDGDTASDSKVVDLGGNVRFADDGPIAEASLSTGSVTHDETAGLQSSAGANDTADAAVAALFSSVTNKSSQLTSAGYASGTGAVIDTSNSLFGADGAAAANSKTYSLTVSVAGVDSDLMTSAGVPILLYKEGALVVGRVGGTDGAAAFAVAIDSSSGVLSMAQYSAIKHAVTSDPNDALSINDAALQAVVTVTDFDGDQSTASVNMGNRVTVLDDGPALAFGNVIGTGTLNPQYGYWSMAPGSDTLSANGLDIAMTGFQLVKPDGSMVNGTSFTFGEGTPSPDGSGAYRFSGSLTGDLDNNAATSNTTGQFTLTALANGTYAIDLMEGFRSTVTESTANGRLGAGGPDPVQTLTITSPTTDSVVFFSVKTAATDAQIQLAIGSGATDLTEAQLQASLSTYGIDPRAMNVSTSGIGVDNNVLQGDNNATIGGTDESFVINPGTLASSVKVFVDNSVTGYNYSGGERLYYKTFYTDGTNSGNVLITTNLGLTNKGQPGFFTIDGGGKFIDAVQLTMAKGDVKIPEIQLTTEINNLVNGIKLDFTAQIADKDGDMASTAFATNLLPNALGSTFNYLLNGTTGFDAFNVDLSQLENKYQINSFGTGETRDRLVLLGNVAANGIQIDNSGANSIVTVAETSGQTTIVTVVGVDLQATDIFTIA